MKFVSAKKGFISAAQYLFCLVFFRFLADEPELQPYISELLANQPQLQPHLAQLLANLAELQPHLA